MWDKCGINSTNKESIDASIVNCDAPSRTLAQSIAQSHTHY